MLSSVIITDLTKAVSYSHKPTVKQTMWVSVVDPSDKSKVRNMHTRFLEKDVRCFSQFFLDWSDEDPSPWVQQMLEVDGPKESHVNNIISFLEPKIKSLTEIHHLGVNCFAGIARSTAVGMMAWVLAGKTPAEALSEILAVRPQAFPNLRMLRFASARLNVDLCEPAIKRVTALLLKDNSQNAKDQIHRVLRSASGEKSV